MYDLERFGRRADVCAGVIFYPCDIYYSPASTINRARTVNYYNEFDPFAAAWLRELIKEGHISDGVVDERSITEIKPHELDGYKQCHFFAGIGIWSLALRLAGVPDDEPIWTASCPCQPFSATGKQLGNADSRHLFPTLRKLVARCQPARVIGEQVASKLGREWFSRVRLEMATLGYATRGTDTCSAGVGAPNIRQRLYWLADTDCRQRYGITAGKRRQLNGTPAGRIEGDGEFKCGGPTERLADTDGGKPWHGRVQSGGEYGQLAENGATRGLVLSNGAGRNTGIDAAEATGHGHTVESAGPVCGLGHADSPRPQGRDERGHGGHERIAGAAGLAGRVANTHVEHDDRGGFISSVDRGEQRSTKGVQGFWDNFDLLYCTDGKARRIEPGSFPLASGIAGRVGKLRGYGNAINAEVAAAFIQEAFAIDPRPGRRDIAVLEDDQ